MIEPALGWALLSREALRRAEEHLRDGEPGVRDEIGFLALHQAYSDRFFPGTSVLQTRIKYVLFIPWIYNYIAQTAKSGQIWRIIQEEETALAGRLKKTYGMSAGVIGARSYPKPTSQPPSMVYWTALTAWGILRPMADGTYPSRAIVHRHLSRSRPISHLQDDDKQPLEEGHSFFITLPEPPPGLEDRRTDQILELSDNESRFIRQHLASTSRPGQLSELCLLARIAEHRIPIADIGYPWLHEVLDIADEDDREALFRAQQVAALVAVGRAVYAALVESICETDDKRSMPEHHRLHLKQIIQEYGREALKLDIAAVDQDTPYPLPRRILDVLGETQTWLRQEGNLMDLHPLYEQTEIRRKGRRARLAKTLSGRERRQEWNAEEYPLAGPLHYRWSNVQRLLGDL